MPAIKHLVLSAGGHNGFRTYGAVRETAKAGLWRPGHLESIWGTSSGSILGAMVALQYDWAWLDDYLIKRPWDSVMGADERMLSAYTDGGVYGTEVIEAMLGPLLEAKSLPRSVTMAGFTEATGVRLHCVSTNVNGPDGFEKVVFGPETTPECPLLTAVAASAAYPILFKPVRHGGMCLTDGAVLSLYPLTECIESGAGPDEILGFRHEWGKMCNTVPEDGNLFDFATALLTCSIQATCSPDHRSAPPEGVTDVTCKCSFMTYDAMRAAITDQQERERLVTEGAEDGRRAAEEWRRRGRSHEPPAPPTERTSETAPAI